MVKIQLKDLTWLLINPSVTVSAEVIPDVGGDFVRLHYNDINTIKDIDLNYPTLQDFQDVINGGGI